MLVEDEEGVRQIVRLALEKQGYQLLVAANGQEALATLETPRGALDLLLTDMVLPGMSGRQLAKTLTARYPELKVIYMTGYRRMSHHARPGQRPANVAAETVLDGRTPGPGANHVAGLAPGREPDWAKGPRSLPFAARGDSLVKC